MKKFQFIAITFLLCYFCITRTKAQTGPFDAFIEFTNCSQTACISATGGCPPYNYAWCDASTVVDPCYGNTFLPTCDVCSVLVSDACSNTKTVVIEKPIINISTTPPVPLIACSGTATVNITCFGCNPSTTNTYQWSTQPAQTTQTATGLCCNETYCVTVTNCYGNKWSCCVTMPPGFSVDAGPDLTICEGDQVNLSGSGCSGNIQWYSYTAGGNATAIAGANGPSLTQSPSADICYIFECCQLNGCCDRDTVCVTVWSKPVINVVVFNPLCHNTTGGFDLNMSNVTVAISPCPLPFPETCVYNVTNSIGVSGYPAGTYTITVTGANGCTATASYTIDPGPPAMNMTAIPVNPLCCGDNGAFSLNVTGGTPGYTVHIIGLRPFNAVDVFYPSPVFPFSTNLDFPADNYLIVFCDATGCCDTLYRTITDPPCLQMIIETYNDSCYHGCKGMFRVWGSGGTPVNSPQPYAAHLISQPVNGCPSLTAYNEPGQYDEFFQLGAGVYVVELVDANGCTVTASVTITEPPFIVALVNTVPPACYGGNGAFSFSISGGTPGYKIHIVGTDAATNSIDTYYNYNTGQNPFSTFQLFPPGSYSITICDTNNCCFTISRTISQNGPIGAGKFVKNGCRNANNGSISVTAFGGNPPYSYQWNTVPVKTTSVISALSPGTYIVTITDANGCMKKDTSVIANPSTNLLLNTTKTNVRCYGAASGDASVIPAGGTSPYLYNWSNGKTTSAVTNLVAGVYTCTVTDEAGCTKSVIITITQSTQLTVLQSQTNVTFPGGNNGTASASVSGGTPPYTYSWNTIPVKTTSSVTGLSAGTYKLSVSDSKSCQQKVTYIITEPFARMQVNENIEKNEIEISPNPTNGVVFIRFAMLDESTSCRMSIYDITGRLIESVNLNTSTGMDVVRYDFSSYSNGIYMLMISNSKGSAIHKIVKE